MRIFLGICSAACLTLLVWHAPQGRTVSPETKPLALEQVLAWLPADTETIFVAGAPFVMPKWKSPRDDDDEKDREISPQELRELGIGLALANFGFKDALLFKYLKGQTVELAINGSRHFRPPHGLGEMLDESCSIGVFGNSVRQNFHAFLRDPHAKPSGSGKIEGLEVLTFQEQSEADLLTLYVALPQENVLIVATNQEYLGEVLRRMKGASGPRALPETLPEWKFVNRHSPAWALRHFDRSQAQEDPTSPFGGQKAANLPDEDAVGIVFQLDVASDRRATITYLSSPKGALALLPKEITSPGEPDVTKAMQIRTRELEPGVVEGSYRVASSEVLNNFLFGLMAAFGHAVYL